MPISFRITHASLGKEEMCAEILTILRAHGWDDIVLMSHSYGSVVSTHMLDTPSLRKRVAALVLADPVSILLHLPDVCYNFTTREPRQANEHQLYYFASKDIGVAHTLARHFFWSQNILWKHDLEGMPVTVSLSGRDLIVDTDAVGRYLTNPAPNGSTHDQNGTATKNERDEEWKSREWKGEGIDVLWFEHLDHAQVFDSEATRRRLIKVVKRYCDLR